MSKRAARFNQNSGWETRDDKPSRQKQWKSGVGHGSHAMANGEAQYVDVASKERLIVQVKLWVKEGKLGKMMRCPYCKQPVGTANFEKHVKRKH